MSELISYKVTFLQMCQPSRKNSKIVQVHTLKETKFETEPDDLSEAHPDASQRKSRNESEHRRNNIDVESRS